MPTPSALDWAAINKMVADGTYTDSELGAAVKSYIRESVHGGWDGFEKRDMTGVRRVLSDMAVYVENFGPDVEPKLDYTVDNRDVGETWLHVEGVGRLEVDPFDLLMNAYENLPEGESDIYVQALRAIRQI